MKTLLVSMCLLGINCRYDGKRVAPLPELAALRKKYILVPVCPEQMGGLTTPRAPSERQGDRVVMLTGRNVTAEYARGAEETLRLARLFGCEAALLKERSPSCGYGEIYDGTFSGTKVSGDGITAALLARNGIAIYGESRAGELL